MARKVVLIDDITGDVIQDGLEQTIRFSVDDKHYRLDLGVKSADEFHKDLKKWIDASSDDDAVQPARRRKSATSDGRASTSSGRSKEELQAIRNWACKEGIEVSPRGRIKAEIIDQFDKAHKS